MYKKVRQEKVMKNRGKSERNVLQETSFQNLVQSLNDCVGYLLGVSILTPDGKLEQVLLTDEFPKGDMLVALAQLRNLAIKELENPPVRIIDFKLPEEIVEEAQVAIRQDCSE